MFETFNFGQNIKRKFICFDVNPKTPLLQQTDHLYEDMIHISYSGGYDLDVGWYPEHNVNGRFVVYVVQAGDWENPMFKYECKDLDSLHTYLEKCVEFIATAPKMSDDAIEEQRIRLYGE